MRGRLPTVIRDVAGVDAPHLGRDAEEGENADEKEEHHGGHLGSIFETVLDTVD
jgi:hypothetical protein